MKIKSILLSAAVVLAASAGSVQAGEALSKLFADIPGVKLTNEEMKELRGGDHVIRLIQLRAGRTPPSGAAVGATTAAGSIGMVGEDRPKILILLNSN